MKESYLKNEKELVNKGEHLARGENLKITKEEREITIMQARKAQIMDALHDELKTIDGGEGTIWGRGQISRDALYNKEDEKFLIESGGKEKTVATLGDLIADASLGCEYNIALETVPRAIAKKYVLERAKTHLNQLLNRQLALQEKMLALKDNDIRRAYHFDEAKQEIDIKERGEEAHAGKMFEQDIVHLLKEMQYDMPELDIEVQEANVVQDMDEKIDFIVKINDYHRGARVEESRLVDNEESHSQHLFGIQFTINTTAEVQKYKEKQVRKSKEQGTKSKVDDIMLITVPMSCKDIVDAHKKWREQGCPTGGPGRFYSEKVRTEILKEIVDKIGAKNIVEKHKEEIERYFSGKH